MNNDKIRQLLDRASEGEDVDQIMAELEAKERTNRAQRNLEDMIADDDDMTGQDNEERINCAADDLIRARDRELRDAGALSTCAKLSTIPMRIMEMPE